MTDFVQRPTAFVLVTTQHGPLLVNRHDQRTDTEAPYGVGHDLLNFSCFAPDEIQLLKQLADARRKVRGEGLVMLDCGANIGVHTIELAKHMHGWGEVVGIEAQERIFYALAGNITLNNCFNARAVWAAVGDQAGKIKIPIPDYFKSSSFGSLELVKRDDGEFIGQTIDYEAGPACLINMIRIDDLPIPRLDMVKIDVEGMELAALQGGAGLIGTHLPYLLVEVVKTGEEPIRQFVDQLGYDSLRLGMNLLAVPRSDPGVTLVTEG